MSSIFVLLLSTTMSNSAVFRIEKFRATAFAGTSAIRYMPATNFEPSVLTTTVPTTRPAESVNTAHTRFVPGTLGKRTFL